MYLKRRTSVIKNLVETVEIITIHLLKESELFNDAAYTI
jgi:hypothetical protein